MECLLFVSCIPTFYICLEKFKWIFAIRIHSVYSHTHTKLEFGRKSKWKCINSPTNIHFVYIFVLLNFAQIEFCTILRIHRIKSQHAGADLKGSMRIPGINSHQNYFHFCTRASHSQFNTMHNSNENFIDTISVAVIHSSPVEWIASCLQSARLLI